MSEPQDIRAALDPLLATFSTSLKAEMTGELADIYMSGTVQMLQWESEQGMVVYHATSANRVASIKAAGLKPPPGTEGLSRWYMVTDSLTGDLLYATAEDPVIFRYVIPKGQEGKYLWMKAGSKSEYYGTQYAIRTPLPKEFISQVGPPNTILGSIGGTSLPFEGPPIQAAIDWAEKHAATLVTRMDEETQRQLAKVISDGIANKRGPGGLATDIKRELGWMGRGKPSAIKGLTQQGRAYMIARTETASALSQSSLDAMGEMGIEGKEWVTAGDDDVSEECQGNEAEGVIPVNQAFSGGVMAPPQHPNCRCVVAPARMKGVKEPSSVSQAREEFESKYKNANIEHCTCVADDGKVLLTKSGEHTRIQFTGEELKSMRDSKPRLFTHNHPNGSSFSADDLRFAADARIQKLEAVGGNYRYSVQPHKKTGWGYPGDASDSLRSHTRELQAKYEAIYAKTHDAATTSMEHTHEAMQLTANGYGFTYTREAI